MKFFLSAILCVSLLYGSDDSKRIHQMVCRRDLEALIPTMKDDPQNTIRAYTSLATSGTPLLCEDIFKTIKPFAVPQINQQEIAMRLIKTANTKLFSLFLDHKIIKKECFNTEVVTYAKECNARRRSGNRKITETIMGLILKRKAEHSDEKKIYSICCEGDVAEKHNKLKKYCPGAHGIHKNCFLELIDHGLGTCPVCRQNLKIKEKYLKILEEGKTKRNAQQDADEWRAILEREVLQADDQQGDILPTLTPEEIAYNQRRFRLLMPPSEAASDIDSERANAASVFGSDDENYEDNAVFNEE
jgi:hypothetical protein